MIPIPQTVVQDVDSPELPAGFELMNYTIVKKLGAGGFSMTYLATEQLSGRQVVIKENFPFECTQRNTRNLLVGPAGAERKELFEWALKRFVDEARVLIQLNHPSIVPVLNVFESMGTAYYVMPLVRGAVLDKSAPVPGKIDESWLKPVLIKVLQALDYLHGEGMLHRDIKPSNIMLREDGSPVLIDFGTARSSDATHTLTRVGTPGYSPAEQFMSHGKNGPWSDLYSLGATCYRLMTGKEPQDAVERLAEDELPLLAENADLQKRFSCKFLSAIDKSLRMPRRDRWQSAREWLAELDDVGTPAKTAAVVSVQPSAVEKQGEDTPVKGRSFNWGRAIVFALVAGVSSLVGGAILLGIVAAIYWGIRGSKVGKTLLYILLSIGAVIFLWVALLMLCYTIMEDWEAMCVWPGAICLGGFAAIYQFMKGESPGRAFLFLFIGAVVGAVLGYVYSNALLGFYAGLFDFSEQPDVLARFLGAIAISLFASAISALVGGFYKKD
ncbi:MAG: protein kinase [Akkermansia sp.]|nr:protein kinase [Akkermansia sp.]